MVILRCIHLFIIAPIAVIGSYLYSSPKFLHLLAKWFLRSLPVEIRLSRALPKDHYIFANHQGWLDTVILASLVPLRFIAKSELSKVPFLGRGAKNMGTMFVQRGTSLDKQLKLKHDILTSKYPVVCFPEGTTNAKIGKLKLGILDFVDGIEKPSIALYMKYDPQAPALFLKNESLFQSILKVLGHKGKIQIEITWVYLDLNDKFSTQTSMFFKDMERSNSEF